MSQVIIPASDPSELRIVPIPADQLSELRQLATKFHLLQRELGERYLAPLLLPGRLSLAELEELSVELHDLRADYWNAPQLFPYWEFCVRRQARALHEEEQTHDQQPI